MCPEIELQSHPTVNFKKIKRGLLFLSRNQRKKHIQKRDLSRSFEDPTVNQKKFYTKVYYIKFKEFDDVLNLVPEVKGV